MKTEPVYQIIKANPGIAPLDILEKLPKPDNWFIAMFQPSIGGLYAVLERLERSNLVRSEWTPPTPKRGNLPGLRYWVTDYNSEMEREHGPDLIRER